MTILLALLRNVDDLRAILIPTSTSSVTTAQEALSSHSSARGGSFELGYLSHFCAHHAFDVPLAVGAVSAGPTPSTTLGRPLLSPAAAGRLGWSIGGSAWASPRVKGNGQRPVLIRQSQCPNFTSVLSGCHVRIRLPCPMTEDGREQAAKAVCPIDKEAWLRLAEEWLKMPQLMLGDGKAGSGEAAYSLTCE